MSLEVVFQEEGIEFRRYPFKPASVFPSGLVGYDRVLEVLPDRAPPEVRTRDGETLFVPATAKDRLCEMAHSHDISVVSRTDVWALILEPFLDTQFDEAQKKNTLEQLEANGMDRQLCVEIRNAVAAMVAYNFDSGLWDWCHLGLMDVLYALSGQLSGEPFRLPDEQFKAFYDRAMELAGRAKLQGCGG